jgi:hypothetical protein
MGLLVAVYRSCCHSCSCWVRKAVDEALRYHSFAHRHETHYVLALADEGVLLVLPDLRAVICRDSCRSLVYRIELLTEVELVISSVNRPSSFYQGVREVKIFSRYRVMRHPSPSEKVIFFPMARSVFFVVDFLIWVCSSHLLLVVHLVVAVTGPCQIFFLAKIVSRVWEIVCQIRVRSLDCV